MRCSEMVRNIMGGFSSHCDVKISLDQSHYSPGSKAKGYVLVSLTKEAYIGDIVAEVTGESVIYSNHRTICQFEQIIYQSHEAKAPGNYRFPFVFEVPRQGTPSTYHAKDGDVAYYIKARTLVGKTKREFRVISHLDELTEENDERAFHSTCLKHGLYGVEVVLQRTEYLSGEHIPVFLSLIREKQSGFSLSPFVTTELIAAVRCREMKGFLTSKVCLARRRIFFPRETPARMRQIIPIPPDAMPATSFETSFEHPVELNYYLNVRMSSKEVQIAIKVGKRRTREERLANDHVETWTTV